MPRAEEIIVDIFRQIQELREAGRKPGGIFLSRETYRHIQLYRTAVGELEDASLDYLGKHDLFNLPVFIDETVAWKVEAETEKKKPRRKR